MRVRNEYNWGLPAKLQLLLTLAQFLSMGRNRYGLRENQKKTFPKQTVGTSVCLGEREASKTGKH